MNQSSYISDMTAITSVKIASAPPQPEPIIWQLAIEQNNRTHLYTLYLSSADSGPEVIRKTKAFLERVVSVPRWKEILSFKHLVVENVLLTSFSDIHLEEGQSYPREVFPLNRQPNPRLFNFSDATILEEYKQFAKKRERGRILLLSYTVNWSSVRIAVAIGLTLSISVGLIVGFSTHRPELGFMTSAGVTAIVGVIVGVSALK